VAASSATWCISGALRSPQIPATRCSKKGQVDDAIERFQTAHSEDQTYAETHRGLANAPERQGKKRPASRD